MKCIGVYKGYHLYYDIKHNEYLLLTPKFHFNRCMSHCANSEVGKWATHMIEQHMKIKDTIKYKE